MKPTKNRLLKVFSANYVKNKGNWNYNLGVGYGERAPSVSEGYGFYLYNSNDFYDYVGNPYLSNEKSGNKRFGSLSFVKIHSKFSTSYFHIQDYIVGKVDETILPMTIGASGVKNTLL